MEQTNNGHKVREREVIAGVKGIETEYRVKKPILEDVTIMRPKFVEKIVEVPVGMEKVIDGIAIDIYERLVKHIGDSMDAKLEKIMDKRIAELNDAINKRITEVKVPKTVYIEKEVVIAKPVFKEVLIEKPVYKDREVVNPILVNKKVINPVFEDVTVDRPVFKEHVVPKPVFEDVIIQKPVYREKEVTVISLKYVDLKGIPEEELK